MAAGQHEAAVDVAVFGAGPAGAVAARVLAAAHSVMLIDRQAEPTPGIGESLIGASRPLLADLGLLMRVESGPHRASLGQASVWGSGTLARRDSIFDPHGRGWQLNRVAFERTLRDGALERRVTVVSPAQAAEIGRNADGSGWTIRLSTSTGTMVLHAQFLVDATGRAAGIAREVSPGARRTLDRLVCRFTRVEASSMRTDLDQFVLVEAVAEGWWYTCRLPDGRRMLAYHTDSNLPAARRSLEPKGFFALLEETSIVKTLVMPPREADIERSATRSQCLVEPVGQGWCAVGDAATAFDPLSSQGLFNALYLGLRGAEAVAATLAGDVDALGHYRDRIASIWAAYERNRYAAYRQETRFRDHAFWRRRLGQAPRVAALGSSAQPPTDVHR